MMCKACHGIGRHSYPFRNDQGLIIASVTDCNACGATGVVNDIPILEQFADLLRDESKDGDEIGAWVKANAEELLTALRKP